MDTSDAWIRERTGIERRHIVAPGETTVDMAEHAARAALAAAGREPTEVDLIVVGSCTPDLLFPNAGVMLQARLGNFGSPALGVEAACSSFIYALSMADKFIRSGESKLALVVGAEAAVTEVVRQLAQAEIKDGQLWSEGRPLTSERLYARAQLLLGEMGFSCPDMIVAGSPECAMPHFRGEGPIRAGAPVIIDIFPSSRASHYHGDLTRTVVVGDVPDEIRRMHASALQALDAGIESIRAGVLGHDVHSAVCQVLVDRGYGTTTKGFEGPDGVPKMNHSTGHGVGLDVHEAPSLRGPSEEVLLEGDVVTVEPGLYLLGLGGVRIEDTGMVTANGFENFTSLTRSLDPKDYF